MPPAALARPEVPVAAAAAMAAIDPAEPSLAAFFKKSRLCSIATVHTKDAATTSSGLGRRGRRRRLPEPNIQQKQRRAHHARQRKWTLVPFALLILREFCQPI